LVKYREQYRNRWPEQATIYQGLRIGAWCNSQRKLFKQNTLESERIELLNRLQFLWNPFNTQWQETYDLLVDFRQKYPNQWPQRNFKVKGINLARWCESRRQDYKNRSLSPERIGKLNKIDFSWDALVDRWQDNYDLLVKYRNQFPSQWPAAEEEFQGAKLGAWCSNQRMNYRTQVLNKERTEKLNKLGFSWAALVDQWQEIYDLLVQYRKQFRNKWPAAEEEYRGVRLARWCHTQRKNRKNNILASERIELLNKLDFPWNPFDEKWQRAYDLLVKYRKQFPNQWPTDEKNYSGVQLASWCANQRTNYKNQILTAARIEKLNKLGFPLKKGER